MRKEKKSFKKERYWLVMTFVTPTVYLQQKSAVSTETGGKEWKLKRKSSKIDVTRHERPPDCVTVTHAGAAALVFRDFCNPNAKETVEDKFLKVMKAEAA